jgi:hypothetical protein
VTRKSLAVVLMVLALTGSVAAAEKITKETFTSQGSDRTYYYSRSSDINKAAWQFLKEKRLEQDPKYQDYVIAR